MFLIRFQWQPQHEDLTCEQFYEWQKANDPEFQKAGLEKHLIETGIGIQLNHILHGPK